MKKLVKLIANFPRRYVWYIFIAFAFFLIFADDSYNSGIDTSRLEHFSDEYIKEAKAATKSPDGVALISGPIVIVRDHPNRIHHSLTHNAYHTYLASTPEEVRTIVLFSRQKGIRTSFRYSGSYRGRPVYAAYAPWSLRIVDRESKTIIYERGDLKSSQPPAKVDLDDVARPEIQIPARFDYGFVRVGGVWGVLKSGNQAPSGPEMEREIYKFCASGGPYFLQKGISWTGLFESNCWDS